MDRIRCVKIVTVAFHWALLRYWCSFPHEREPLAYFTVSFADCHLQDCSHENKESRNRIKLRLSFLIISCFTCQCTSCKFHWCLNPSGLIRTNVTFFMPILRLHILVKKRSMNHRPIYSGDFFDFQWVLRSWKDKLSWKFYFITQSHLFLLVINKLNNSQRHFDSAEKFAGNFNDGKHTSSHFSEFQIDLWQWGW